MTRWKAAGIHLALSILVVGGIGVSAFLLWHPYGLYKVAGLDRILLVMLGIDLTAGPLLTLILYKPGKRGLKFDLAMVAIAQFAFLGYGLHTLWDGRPVFLVATPETFTVVFANEVSDEDLALAKRPEWRRLSWTGPVLVGARMPTAPDARRAVIEEFMAGGAGVERSPKYYTDYAAVVPALLESGARPFPEQKSSSLADMQDSGRGFDELHIAPIVSRRGEGQVILDGATGMPVRVLESALPEQ